jgi:hypothetical protein
MHSFGQNPTNLAATEPVTQKEAVRVIDWEMLKMGMAMDS